MPCPFPFALDGVRFTSFVDGTGITFAGTLECPSADACEAVESRNADPGWLADAPARGVVILVLVLVAGTFWTTATIARRIPRPSSCHTTMCACDSDSCPMRIRPRANDAFVGIEGGRRPVVPGMTDAIKIDVSNLQ